jgi:hypothetical protein
MRFQYLYDLSFSFFVLLTAGAVLASALSLVLPALFTQSNAYARNWNVIAIIASYVALALLSLVIYLSRKITIVQKLRNIPKNLMSTKEGDVPSVSSFTVKLLYDFSLNISLIGGSGANSD